MHGKTLHKKLEDIPTKMMLKRTPGPAHYTPDKLPTNCFVKFLNYIFVLFIYKNWKSCSFSIRESLTSRTWNI